MAVLLFKQKTAYGMRISDWSSDVCSSELRGGGEALAGRTLIGQRRCTASRNQGCTSCRCICHRSLRQYFGRDAVGIGRAAAGSMERSEESRVGKECVSTFRSRL